MKLLLFDMVSNHVLCTSTSLAKSVTLKFRTLISKYRTISEYNCEKFERNPPTPFQCCYICQLKTQLNIIVRFYTNNIIIGGREDCFFFKAVGPIIMSLIVGAQKSGVHNLCLNLIHSVILCWSL